MKKFITVTLKILAVVAIAAAVAYGVYRLLNYEKKPIAVFESNFDDETLPEDEVIEVAVVTPEPEVSDGALDTVDKCMPY